MGQKAAVLVVTTRGSKICSIEKFCCLKLVFINISAVKTPFYPHEIYIFNCLFNFIVVFHKVKQSYVVYYCNNYNNSNKAQMILMIKFY